MRIGELAEQAGATTKAVRYYESLGLFRARRLGNGYRDYDDSYVRLVREIRGLAAVGIPVDQARPFLDCLVAGHRQGDDCPDAVTAYRTAIDAIGEQMAELVARRIALTALLESASARTQPACELAPSIS